MNEDISRKRRAALILLKRGAATQAETAELAGVTRQRLAFWVQRANIDCGAARKRALAKLWEKAMEPVPRL